MFTIQLHEFKNENSDQFTSTKTVCLIILIHCGFSRITPTHLFWQATSNAWNIFLVLFTDLMKKNNTSSEQTSTSLFAVLYGFHNKDQNRAKYFMQVYATVIMFMVISHLINHVNDQRTFNTDTYDRCVKDVNP